MSLTEDLARLKELDLATWKRMIAGIPLRPCGMYTTIDEGHVRCHQYTDARIPMEQLMPEVSLVWLQHCLQEAIAAHDGWTYSVFRVPGEWNYCADVSKTEQGYDGDCWNELHEYLLAEKQADTPAAALLSAYIAALEAQP